MRIPYETPPALGREFIELEPEVVAVILLTLAAGWQRACAAEDVNANAGEVIMTERLRDGMRIALKNSPWKQIMVLPGTESRSKSNVMLPDGRTDIPLAFVEIFLRTQEHDPHAIIECKRIAGSDTHLCRALMATPNCSTYGQSNCSRQDGRMGTIRARRRCVRRPPSVGSSCPRTPASRSGA